MSILQRSSSAQAVFRIRSSKFRHVHEVVWRKDLCYDNIKITKNANDSQFCAVNPKFIAIVAETAGGGSFIVIPIEKTGRIEVNYGRVTGHQGPVLDLRWNPFNDNVIASCSDDCTIRLWYIPDEGVSIKKPITESIMTLCEHKRRVSFIEWHPTADNILASAGYDNLIIIWKTSTGEPVQIINCHPDTIHSMSFNRDGSLLATTCKDKKIRIIDPRQMTVVREGTGHQGPKASKVVYLGDTGRLFTTGFSKYSDRQWGVWSQHDLSKPLTIENIDSSSGVLFPFYDHDTKMVYVAGKGDGSIRYYEVTNEPPYCHYINQFITGLPQRGLGIMPKRGLDVHKCEIFRFYKLHATKPLCEPISMVVPRKSHLFQADIYPDTAAPTPALTADEWLRGKTRSPILISMKTGAGAKTHKPVMFKGSSNSLLTSDVNNDRKFIFLSQENIVDYRPKPPMSKTNGSNISNSPIKLNNDCELLPPISSKNFPWIKDDFHEKEEEKFVYDIVKKQELPVATFVNIADYDSFESRGSPDLMVPTDKDELIRAFKRHVEDIEFLRTQLQLKDERIKQLEKQLRNLSPRVS
ncbi:coronin-2B-like [Brevipalpus obovatus]|uniref:coronin-2B-like n=1 Tax=Brevipalpus obovatus TaxID=246614 RepID=UPI003D9F2D54